MGYVETVYLVQGSLTRLSRPEIECQDLILDRIWIFSHFVNSVLC